jgi:hypothetical protein
MRWLGKVCKIYLQLEAGFRVVKMFLHVLPTCYSSVSAVSAKFQQITAYIPMKNVMHE